MLEIAIAPDAKIGLINPIMATGIKTTLYAKAQNKLSLIVFIVCLDSLIAETTDIKFLLTNVIPAASMATSVPVPIAIPTSDDAKAGASLIPSPTKATTSGLVA